MVIVKAIDFSWILWWALSEETLPVGQALINPDQAIYCSQGFARLAVGIARGDETF